MNAKLNPSHEKQLDVRILPDVRAEIDLNGAELLKLEIQQRQARVLCTEGTLWVTQPGDLVDHLLQAGQSLTIKQRGTILVQGLPAGKARIFPTAA